LPSSNGYVVLIRNVFFATSLPLFELGIILPHNLPLILLPESSFCYHTCLLAQEFEEYVLHCFGIKLQIVDMCIQDKVLCIRTYKEEDSRHILNIFPDASLVSQTKKIEHEINHIVHDIEVHAKEIQKRIVYIIWNIKDCQLYEHVYGTYNFKEKISQILFTIIGFGWTSTSSNTQIIFFNYNATSSYEYLSEYLHTITNSLTKNPFICCFGTDTDVNFLSNFTKNIIHISVSVCTHLQEKPLVLFRIPFVSIFQLNQTNIPTPPHFTYMVSQISHLYPKMNVFHMGFDKLTYKLSLCAYGYQSELNILEHIPNIGKVILSENKQNEFVFQKYIKTLQYDVHVNHPNALEQLLKICVLPPKWKNLFFLNFNPSSLSVCSIKFPIIIQVEVHVQTGQILNMEMQEWIVQHIQNTEESNITTSKSIQTRSIVVYSWNRYNMITQYCTNYVFHNENVDIVLMPTNVLKYTIFPIILRIQVCANDTAYVSENIDIIHFNIIQIVDT
jgi:hypothetical protein